MAKQQRVPTPRFGIGEWYGHSFARLTVEQRRAYAAIALHQTKANSPVCPFKLDGGKCTKKGGICSLRLYEWAGDGTAKVLEGPDGDLRCTCPIRFRQGSIIYRAVAKVVLGVDNPKIVDEVRFLQRIMPESLETTSGKQDVGNIDNVLVDAVDLKNWCALEVQTVYFSGKKMSLLFEHIRDYPSETIPFPDRQRRPDYRSSGPKRLMPQLQIKVPTLRRWGKKMAVAVDAAWFRANVINVDTVSDLSNADIAWCLVDYDETTDPHTVKIERTAFHTLERAVEGLTGGFPVTLREFEAKMAEKIAKKEKPRKKRKSRRPPEIAPDE